MTARHLLITNDFPPKLGGIQAYLWELWRRLDPDSFVVLAASSHPAAPAFDAEQTARGYRIRRVPGSVLYLPTPGLRARVRQLAAEEAASLVVLDPALPLGLLGPTLDLPYGVVLHGAEVAIPGRLPATRQGLGQVVRRAAVVISAGHYPAAEAARAAGGRHNIVEIPPGVDCARFTPADPDRWAATRRRLGLGPGPLVVSVSRLVPRKGMDVLIESVHRLLPSFPDLTVAIAGDGRQAGHLASLAERRRVPVRFLGLVPEEEKADLLAAADVFVMACRDRWLGLEQEGFGIVFLEAAAAGVPQVAGASGGAAEAVADGVTGLVVRRPSSPGDVALAIRSLLVDEGRRRLMGAAARKRALASFDYDVLAPRLAAALEEVAGSTGPSRPGCRRSA